MKVKVHHLVLGALAIVSVIALLPFTSFEEIDCEEIERNKPDGHMILCDDFSDPFINIGMILIVPILAIVGIIIIIFLPVKKKEDEVKPK